MNTENGQTENSRLGLTLFAVYTLFYAGFVLVNAFAAEWGEWIVFAGLNLAVVWGFALILFAFVLAIVYGVLSSGSSQDVEDAKSVQSQSEVSK